MPRKRTRDEMEAAEPEVKKQEPSLLQRIRNMWEFASTMQFIFMFGKAVKIDEDFDIEDFENECLRPGHSEKLEEIGLTLLKWISSHRGLNYDIWDEYTRRQYLSKAPSRNPYGEAEEPNRFRDFDIFTKIRILHQLTVWTFWNPDRMREKMADHPREVDQLEWRLEEFGYDKDDRQYYLLDDNRLYRRTEPALPAAPKAKPKSNTKKAIAARRRASKRRKVESETPEPAEEDEQMHENSVVEDALILDPSEIDTFGGYKWECLAINLKDYEELCQSFAKSRDPNEKVLKERIEEEVVPIIQQAEERQKRKIERRQRELMMMEKMVGAKRSSRLADKQDKERRDAEALETERKRQADLAEAHREQERQEKMEQERQFRMMTREQRIKEREYKRLLKQEELEKDAAEQKRIEEGEVRGSGRHLKERIEKNKKELEDLSADEDWTFDCSGCGKHGKNYDDGSHSVACEKCNVWQHSKCLGISKSAAEKDDFHFVCKDCKRKEEDAKKPKISLKFKLGSSSSPVPPSPVQTQSQFVGVHVPKQTVPRPPSQGLSPNGVRHPQSSPPPLPFSSPYRPQSTAQNGSFYHYDPSQSSYAQVTPQPRPTSSGSQHSPNQSAHGIRPALTSYSFVQVPPIADSSRLSNGAGNQRSPIPGQTFSYDTPHQSQNQPTRPQPLATGQHSSQRPEQSHFPNQAHPNGARLPSPVFNRPTMSPTQGNMDVGPVAGIPQKLSSQNQTVNGHARTTNSIPQYAQSTPGPHPHGAPAQTPSTQPLSGLSPRKQQTPLPSPVSFGAQKSNSVTPMPDSQQTTFPPSSGSEVSQGQKRSVSGTPILPPVENLRPSPEQMRNMSSNEPVPTPSKQSPPQPPHHGQAVEVSGVPQHSTPTPTTAAPQGLGIRPSPQTVKSGAE